VTVRSPVLLLLAALILSLGVVGCGGSSATRSSGELPASFPNHSASEIRTQIRQSSDTLRQYTAEARVRVRSPQEQRSFNATIRHRRADSLFMRVSLFGFEGGRLLLTPDSVFFYDSRKQTLRTGGIAQAQELLPVPVATDEIFENLLGLIAPGPETAWSVEADSSLYYVSNASDTEQWTVDPSQWRVVRYTRESPDGTLLEVRRYGDFRSVRGRSLPHSVTFQRPDADQTATITYRQIRLNPTGISFELGVPSEVPRKPIRSR
jgi:outer membrane biogenesis lipoprotein LolB